MAERGRVSDGVKIALILSATVLIAVSAWIYFSPFQTCVRAQMQNPGLQMSRTAAQRYCAEGFVR
jgi:hypothetical protein